MKKGIYHGRNLRHGIAARGKRHADGGRAVVWLQCKCIVLTGYNVYSVVFRIIGVGTQHITALKDCLVFFDTAVMYIVIKYGSVQPSVNFEHIAFKTGDHGGRAAKLDTCAISGCLHGGARQLVV